VHRDMGGNHHIASDLPPRSVSSLAAEDSPHLTTSPGNHSTGAAWWVYLSAGVGVVVAAAMVALIALKVAHNRRSTAAGDGSVTYHSGDNSMHTVENRARSSSVQVIDLDGIAPPLEGKNNQALPTMGSGEVELPTGLQVRSQTSETKDDMIPPPAVESGKLATLTI